MKIGFLAMSGIRANDPELLRRGLTLPGFVERSRQVAALPSLGLLYLASSTPLGRHGVEHELHYFEAPKTGDEPLEVYDCDLVAISTFSAQVAEAYDIADRLRAGGVKVAMGGLHVTARPEEAREHADYVVVGEGENVWPELVRAAERGAPSHTWRAADFEPVDVASLPVPRFDLLESRPYNRYTVQASRGCPYRCEFCASTVMLARPYRKRPVEHVVRDIQAILELHPGAFIELADDNTFVDAEWGKELCRALIPLRIKWFTETDISVADDEELLELLRRSGCRQLLIGLESPGGDPLSGLELSSDFKARRHDGCGEAVRRIQAHGISVNGCFVLGLDGQGPEVFEQVAAFAEETDLFEVQITVQTAFPGTPLYERLDREGRLTHPGKWSRCTLFDVNYVPDRMTADELRAGMYSLSERLYSAEAMRARRAPFFEGLRRSGQRAAHAASA